MTDQPKLYGIERADGSIYQSRTSLLGEDDRGDYQPTEPGAYSVEVEIVRVGTVAELRKERDDEHDKFLIERELALIFKSDCARERAAIVARLEAALDNRGWPLHTQESLLALLSDLKAGRVEGKT